MKKVIITSVILASAVAASLFSQDEGIRLAVARFDDSTTSAGESEKAGFAVSTLIETGMTGIKQITVRREGAIKNYLAKLEMAQVGFGDLEALKGIGKTLKINYLTVGTIAKMENGYEVDERTVNIDNWMIVQSRGCTVNDIPAAAIDIEREMRRSLTVESVSAREKELPDAKKPRISVARFKDFSPAVQKTALCGVLPEVLNSELGAYKDLFVVERKYARSLVNEKILEMIGVVENDNIAASFTNIGIGYMVEGDIRSFKDVISVNYRIFETADRRVVYLGSMDITSPSVLRPLSKSIAAAVNDVLNNRIATLKLASVPSGAEVFIDGAPCGNTPLVYSIQKGKHDLKLRLAGFKTAEEVIDIVPRTINSKSVNLERLSLQLFQSGLGLENSGNWEGAVASYKKFIDEYSDSPEVNQAYYRKGHIEMVNLKRFPEALETFQTLVNRYPDAMIRAEAYYGMAKVYHVMGNKSKTRDTLKYIIEHYGETPAAEEARVANFK
ncbi:MAG: PEGA domain-containing protein [Spirochaetes bacterium]|jgi:tetratricopeptide (TPR) repeat protein|nr:PEGA domain-containing protein [Spirochaetota bacterium]